MRLTNIDFLKIAISQLRRNKGRSFLTILGVIIGVSSVVLLVSIGNGLRFFVQEQFESLGANKLYVMPGNLRRRGGFNQQMMTTVRFDFKDVNSLEKVRGVDKVAPVSQLNDMVTFSNKEVFVEVTGSTVDIEETIEVAQGRFFSKAEESRGAKVGVIGAKVNEELFNSQNPLGKKFNVGGKKIKVIGVAKERGGSAFGMSPDAFAMIPYKVLAEITGEDDFYSLFIVTENEEEMALIKERAENVLLKRYEEDDFSVADQSQILSIFNQILSAFTAALAGIASISLLVGGVGIMNIMFVSVTERIKEIGLRKAVGARPKDILLQFLLESVVVAVTGGVIGIILSCLATLLINKFFPAVVTFWSVLLAFGVSALIGIIFGVAPARRAAKLSPIDALRYE